MKSIVTLMFLAFVAVAPVRVFAGPRQADKPLVKNTEAKPKPIPGCEAIRFETAEPNFMTGSNILASRHARKISNPELFKQRGQVWLPIGCANVALNKPVTTSDGAPIKGTTAQVTDGVKRDYEDSVLFLNEGAQWVQIDLQKSFNLHGILLWHYYSLQWVYRDVVVQVADDADFKKNVRTVFNNDGRIKCSVRDCAVRRRRPQSSQRRFAS